MATKTTKKTKRTKKLMSAGGSGVCWVDPATGTVTCSSNTLDVTSLEWLRRELPARGAGSEAKMELILQLVSAVLRSTVADGCVAARTAAIVGAVQAELAPTPPSVLLFHWDLLPRDAMLQYFNFRLDDVGMDHIIQLFSNPVPSCQ